MDSTLRQLKDSRERLLYSEWTRAQGRPWIFCNCAFGNSVGKIHLKKTSGVSKPEISSDFAIAALLIQLKAGAIFARLSGIDPQGAAAYFLAVELLDSCRAFFARRHFDEAEAARATCFAIFNQGYAFDRARLREQCS
jgi:hypothetical protein